MRVIDVARQLGIGPDWIRRLERQGRIPPASRDCNGYRRYSPEAVEAIRALLFGGKQPPAKEGNPK